MGNCAISALVDKQARIVWCCLPRFDGDPVFHQLLGSASCDPDDGAFTVELVDFKSCEQSLFPIPGICAKMTTRPWTAVVLPRKFIELVGIAVNAACTSLNPEATRRHIRAALEAGATRDEVLMVLKMASIVSIHSCSLGAPILLEEARAAGANP
ncbi:MAG: carboxymuconolactone decarboxylase family protein, partial [Rhodomicrobium sp.]